MKFVNICNKIIEYGFYAIFFFVPFALAPDTSELFEFNKLWLTFILSLVILTAWISKMLIKRQFKIQKTPLDIPIVLFLLSQVVSTVFSLDRHVSLWGYYSRFNGGLLSIITYIFLYYVFVSNFRENGKTIAKRLIYVALSSAVIVALWGLPSHFGFDPTCLVFRGTFDVSCWTNDFQPMVRIFSTMGQPDWLSAYLGILFPITIAFFIKSKFFKALNNQKPQFSRNLALLAFGSFLMFLLFYIDIDFTRAKSGIIATWISVAFFMGSYIFLELKNRNNKIKNIPLDFKLIGISIISISVITFIIGTSFSNIDNRYSFSALRSRFTASTPATAPTTPVPLVATPAPAPLRPGYYGATDTGKIRLFVWHGAIDAWLHNPVFGTGVETFAFAYYKYRPEGHNLTSEWRFLYNKAHNEYLNYLATTGAFGLLTYLSIIGLFLFLSFKYLLTNKGEDANNKRVFVLALVSGYISILITNFFGFSVVMVNLFMFLIPAFIFMLTNQINYDKNLSFSFPAKKIENKKIKTEEYPISNPIWAIIGVVIVINGFLAFTLISYWNADKDYGLGYNYDRVNNYQAAYPLLTKAVGERPDEPVFKDELSINNAVLAISVLKQKFTDQAQQKQGVELAQKFAQEAIAISDQITTNYPNNIVFWKTRVRIFYTLAQVDQRYYASALAAIKKTAELAPTDADISYNLGILYGQNGDAKNAAATLENTVKLKHDYSDAYYALGIFYHQLAVNDKGQVVNEQYLQKAIDTMNFMLKNVTPGDSRPIDALKTWTGR